MAPSNTKIPADTAPYAKRVADIVSKAQELRRDLLISDATSKDPKGGELQWVDLVLAGGGLLGIAHVGFVYILEEAGIRFRGIGGTSAGAINAMLIAALRDGPDGVSWQKTLQELADAPFATFQDNEGFFVKLLQGIRKEGLRFGPKLAAWLLWNTPKLVEAFNNKGIHSGNKFLDWVTEVLEKNGVHNMDELKGKLSLSSIHFKARAESIRPSTEHGNEADNSIDAGMGSRPRPLALPAVGTDIQQIDGHLALVASDVTTETKVVFPEDTDLYYAAAVIADANRNLPAEFVRASMSVPYFFQPLTLTEVPDAGSGSELWKQRNGYEGKVPRQVYLVDGGTLSNFPIDLFHVQGRPLLPTIGVQFGHDRNKPNCAANLLELAAAMNNSSRHLSDREFILHNPDYKQLVAVVDNSPMDVPGKPGEKYEFDWLNFNMSTEEQVELFRRGAEAALDFLNTWHKDGNKWALYKDFRSRKADFE